MGTEGGSSGTWRSIARSRYRVNTYYRMVFIRMVARWVEKRRQGIGGTRGTCGHGAQPFEARGKAVLHPCKIVDEHGLRGERE